MPETSTPAASSGNGAPKGDKAAEKPADETTQADPTFTVDELASVARRQFGVSKHAVRGALSGESADTFTVEDARRLVKAWMKRTVDDGSSVEARGLAA